MVPRTGALSTELLRLAATRVRDKKGPVVGKQLVLEYLLGRLVDELLVVSDDALGDSLADGVDLRRVTTAGDAQANVDVSEALGAEQEQRLEDLRPQALGLQEVQRRTVQLHQALSIAGDVRNSDSSLLPAEALHRVLGNFCGTHVG